MEIKMTADIFFDLPEDEYFTMTYLAIKMKEYKVLFSFVEDYSVGKDRRLVLKGEIGK